MMGFHGSMNMLGAVLIVLAGCLQCVSADSNTEAPPEVLENNGTFYAACKVRPSSTLAPGLPKVYGQVLFKQHFPDGILQVRVSINGFPANSDIQLQAMHIHQYGDLSRGCVSTGGHYDPFGDDHPEHPGDFGNFETQKGKINAVIQSNATLFGKWSVIGRAVVIHEKHDDMGLGGDARSLLHGNAGPRLGCCIIGISPPSHWNTRSLRRY
ncbi:extracellular superoxide dismutase [Cu-Zn]-like [Antennarius striatus]|uniref:extracellular superoxide dismutase [Cu-Zn]-like n=1 Tax=Antennarius striatus TaxID=241820 RepID=UPI0035B4387A